MSIQQMLPMTTDPVNITLDISSVLSHEYRQLSATLSLTLSSCYSGLCLIILHNNVNFTNMTRILYSVLRIMLKLNKDIGLVSSLTYILFLFLLISIVTLLTDKKLELAISFYQK